MEPNMPLDTGLSERLPTLDETRKAREATRVLARATKKDGALHVRLCLNEQKVAETLDLPPAISRLVLDLLLHISKGEAVTFMPIAAELSTQEAADLLNVSRPFLIKLLETAEIPHHKVGRHRRIHAADLLAYKQRRDAKRKKSLADLIKLGQEIDAE
jgi:excisionase family DNA binding protein